MLNEAQRVGRRRKEPQARWFRSSSIRVAAQMKRARLPGFYDHRLPSHPGWWAPGLTCRAARCQQWQWRQAWTQEAWATHQLSLKSPAIAHANVLACKQGCSSLNFRLSNTGPQPPTLSCALPSSEIQPYVTHPVSWAHRGAKTVHAG